MKAPPENRRIALFGGTFDPVHVGHLHLARIAVESLGLDELRFLPCRISPHKLATIPSRAEDRVRMLELAVGDLPWASVDDYELQLPGPSFSYQTAEAFAARFPTARLFWIMGGDQWNALPTWKHPERLAAQVEFIVLARGAHPEPRDGYRMHLIAGDHPASSSAIRSLVAEGETDLPWLPKPVAGYIRQHRLYAM